MANMVTYPLNKIEYQATDAELFHCTRNSGVYGGDDFNMSVTSTDNVVTIAPGVAWIRNSRFSGKVFGNKSNVSIDCGIAEASLPRWDVICIQFDKNNNGTNIVVKKGVPASSPAVPAISQTETLYELYLCKIYRPAGSVAITAGNVYDMRLDKSVCGLMADSVTEIDTTAINAQVTALIENLKKAISGVTDTTGLMLKSEYDANGDGYIDTAATVEQGEKIDALTTDITSIKYVTALPENPDENTLYLIKK